MYTIDNEAFRELFPLACRAAVAAGRRIMEIYRSDDFQVSMKSDNSPLSSADKEAHDIIKKHLLNSCIPILSEEGRDLQFEERKSWDVLWIVDPMDGTRQFIGKRDEFTVNIALVTGEHPVFGVIYAPAMGDLYFGIKGTGSFKLKVSDKNPPSSDFQSIMTASERMPSLPERNKFTILASYNHVNKETLEYIAKLQRVYPDAEVRKVGSSLKLCMLADGIGDTYARYTDTYEWDTAAGQAILESAGWCINSMDTDKPLYYNKESLLNPYFVCKRKRH